MGTRKHIDVDPKVMLGRPVIRGTRITVELVLRKLAEGATVQDLLDAHPTLTTAGIRAALALAADALAREADARFDSHLEATKGIGSREDGLEVQTRLRAEWDRLAHSGRATTRKPRHE